MTIHSDWKIKLVRQKIEDFFVSWLYFEKILNITLKSNKNHNKNSVAI